MLRMLVEIEKNIVNIKHEQRHSFLIFPINRVSEKFKN